MTQHDLLDRARAVKLLCIDVDGVLTDAGMYYGANGEVLKKFNARDGMGLQRLRDHGIAVALITGEDSDIVRARASKLRIDAGSVFSGVLDKGAVVETLAERMVLPLSALAFIGDDLNDLAALVQVGFPCCVADAQKPVWRGAID